MNKGQDDIFSNFQDIFKDWGKSKEGFDFKNPFGNRKEFVGGKELVNFKPEYKAQKNVDENFLKLSFNVKGFTKENVRVSVNERKLTLELSKATPTHLYEYKEDFVIKANVLLHLISAEVKNGTLTIAMPYDKEMQTVFEVKVQ